MSKINNKEYFAISYFLSRAFFLGIGYSYIYQNSSIDSWISMIIGYLIGLLIIILFHKISINSTFNLKKYLDKNKKIGFIFKIILLLIYSFFIILSLMVFTSFIKSYYLFNTPSFVIIFSIITLALYLGIMKENVIGRFSLLLMPVSLFMIFLILSFLVKYIDIENFTPLLMTSSKSILLSALIFALFSAVPHLLLIDNNIKLKTKIISYSFSSFLSLISSLFIISILGEYYIKIYGYPEYMVLKKIKLLNFIENIEKIISLVWYGDVFVMISMSINKINGICKKKYITIITIIFLGLITIYYQTKNFYYIMSLYKYGLYVFLSILIIFIIIYFISKKKKD